MFHKQFGSAISTAKLSNFLLVPDAFTDPKTLSTPENFAIRTAKLLRTFRYYVKFCLIR